MENEREQLKKALLYITDEIVRICNKHDIQYFIDCGTLIGAVRHQGFIPWDDDIDIGMTKENYLRFLSVAEQELGDDFFLDNYSTNPDNALVFSKVRLKGTKYIEAKGNEKAKHNEIFVDIFPYFYVSEDARQRRMDGVVMCLIAQAIMSKSGYKVWKGDSFKKRLKFLPTDILGAVLPMHKLRSKMDEYYNRYEKTSLLCIHDGTSYRRWFIPKEIFETFMDAPFEDRVYKIPCQYDSYLKIAYGDYMTLPPVEKRTTHMVRDLDFGKYSF